MIEIRNEKLVVEGYVIGGKKEILAIFEKAREYDRIKSDFEGDSNE